MSRTIFRDIEDAISREIRRLGFFDKRTVNLTVLEDTYDVFTGEPVKINIEPNYYDSSADTNNIQYPHFFVKLLKTREDRFTGRVIPPYSRMLLEPSETAPKSFALVARDTDGQIAAPGNTFQTSTFRIKLVQPGFLLRIQSGNNIGTYTIATVTPNNSGLHTITVSNTLLSNLPVINFDTTFNDIYFTTSIDLTTIKLNDKFVDASAVSYLITEICKEKNSIKVLGPGTPNLAANATIVRIGNVFQTLDSTNDIYLILDPTKPIEQVFPLGQEQATNKFIGRSPSIPIDAYYLVRIDSKERDTHIDVLNRMWEEFNPPRTALPTIVRGPDSDYQLLTCDAEKNSQLLVVRDNKGFNINDSVFVFDNFHPTKGPNDNFEIPFSAKVIAKIGKDQIKIDTPLPYDFKIDNVSKVVSNAYYYLHMFHFVDHNTRDNEGAQYWVHEFTFWVQVFIDRLETPANYSALTDIAVTLKDSDGTIIIQDN